MITSALVISLAVISGVQQVLSRNSSGLTLGELVDAANLLISFYLASPLPLILSFSVMRFLQGVLVPAYGWPPLALVLRSSLLTSEMIEELRSIGNEISGVRTPSRGLYRLRTLMKHVNEDLTTILRGFSLITINPIEAKSLARSDSLIDKITMNGIVITRLLVSELRDTLMRCMRGDLDFWELLNSRYVGMLLEYLRGRSVGLSMRTLWVKTFLSASGLLGISAANLVILLTIILKGIDAGLLIFGPVLVIILLYFYLQQRSEAYRKGIGVTSLDLLIAAVFFLIAYITSLEALAEGELALFGLVILYPVWLKILVWLTDPRRSIRTLHLALIFAVFLALLGAMAPFESYLFLIPWSLIVLIAASLERMSDT